MLKARVIPTLLYRDSGLVKGEKFDAWRQVGSAIPAVQLFNMRDVDELVFLDIDATRAKSAPDYALVDEIADHCRMPLAVGGGVASVDCARELLRVGADKVVLGTAAVQRPQLISEIADQFGSQAVVVSIDVTNVSGESLVVCVSGRERTGLEPVQWATRCQALGAGEVLLTSVDRDGTRSGFDIELVRRVTDAVTIPVIAAGGGGTPADFARCMVDGGASAVAGGAMFQFTQFTPRDVKLALREAGVPVRLAA